VLAPQDAVTGGLVSPNDQPVTIEPADLVATFAKLPVYESKAATETVPLFDKDAARRLSFPLSVALGRATADQDILFAIEVLQKASILGYNPVSVAGRAFYQSQRLHVIIGELHVSTVSPEYKSYPIGYPTLDRRLHPHQTGGRSQESRYDSAAYFEAGDGVSLFEHNGTVRNDWLILNVGALASSGEPAGTAPRRAPAAIAEGSALKRAGAGQAEDSVPLSIEQRLQRLKHLRERDLITDQEYERKRNEMLDQL